ncbi:MAG: hypothetical protein QG657_2462 [Acidobacteriota bacterium]|nr:hypothetical protein [Acidobacteriota bacterium]
MNYENSLDKIVKLMNCRGCSCCDAGLIYALPGEVSKLRGIGVEVIEYMGGYFIPTTKEKGCVCYNASEKKCEIYPDRPLCCRLFPFDLFYYANRGYYWVVYNKCPWVWLLLSDPANLHAIKLLLRNFQLSLGDEDLMSFYRKEVSSVTLERGKKADQNYTIICPSGRGIYKTPISHGHLFSDEIYQRDMRMPLTQTVTNYRNEKRIENE